MHFACQSILCGKQRISRAIGGVVGVVVAAMMRLGVDNPAPDHSTTAPKAAVEGALCWEMNSDSLLANANDLLYVDVSPS